MVFRPVHSLAGILGFACQILSITAMFTSLAVWLQDIDA